MSEIPFSVLGFTMVFVACHLWLLRRTVQRNLLTQNSLLFWFAVALALFLMALFPAPMIRLTSWLGFEIAANGVFFLAIGFLMFLNLLQSLEISRLNRMILSLTQAYSLKMCLSEEVEAGSFSVPRGEDGAELGS